MLNESGRNVSKTPMKSFSGNFRGELLQEFLQNSISNLFRFQGLFWESLQNFFDNLQKEIMSSRFRRECLMHLIRDPFKFPWRLFPNSSKNLSPRKPIRDSMITLSGILWKMYSGFRRKLLRDCVKSLMQDSMANLSNQCSE